MSNTLVIALRGEDDGLATRAADAIESQQWEIDELRTRLEQVEAERSYWLDTTKQLRKALGVFADPGNWSSSCYPQQWVWAGRLYDPGKYACDVLQGKAEPQGDK